jgi:sulfate adenylyltransferase
MPGVGDYYGKYDAHRLTERFDGELGITILRLSGPFYCRACDGIATERSCDHERTDPGSVVHIAGTAMRAMLSGGMEPDRHLMRPEVIMAARGVPLFVEREDA